MATQTAVLTFDDFMDLPDPESFVRELEDGVLIERPSPRFVQERVTGSLALYLDETGADFELSLNTDFRLGPNTVRAPDICLVRTASLEAMPVVRGVLQGAPDLAVEVISPSETAIKLSTKIEQYLAAGTTAVWAFYEETRLVMVHRRSGEVFRLTADQTLEEPELLPGLRIPLAKIFRAIKK